jgi:hypothetical protein
VRAWLAVGLGLAACSKPAPPGVVVAEAGAVVAALPSTEEPPSTVSPSSTEPAQPPPAPTPAGPPAPAGEAKRTTVASLDRDPVLRAQLATLRDHFGPDARGPFAVQTIERAGGGSAVLVTRADESDPIVLALDRDQLVFVRKHPVAGITPPAVHLAIVPGPERGIALFSYVAALDIVAARMTADDGNPFAEIVAFTTDACDALAAAYAQGWGWIVACSSKNGTRAQLLKEDLTPAWGSEGALVGNVGPVARASISFDSASTWMLTQRVKAVGGERTLTFRYGPDAQPTPSSSTSNTSVEFGGITGGKPRAP